MPYQYSGGTLTLTYPDGDVEFTLDATSSINDLVGSWIATGVSLTVDDMGTPLDTTDDVIANAATFDCDASGNYEILFFDNTEQIGGNQGILELMGVNLAVNVTQSWDETDFWQDNPETAWVSYSYGGTTLAIESPIGMIAFTETAFSVSADIAGIWQSITPETVYAASSDGSYEFYSNEETMNPESGTWEASSTMIRSVVIQKWDDVNDQYVTTNQAYLTPYTLSAGTLTMTHPGGSLTYTESTSTATITDAAGVWIMEATPTAIIEVGTDGSFERIVYGGTSNEQTEGSRGTLKVIGDFLVINTAEEWMGDQTSGQDYYWATDSDVSIIRYTLVTDQLTIHDSEGDMGLTPITFGLPTDLVGTWTMTDGPTLTFADTGLYGYVSASPYIVESGTWDASGTTSGYFRVVTTERDTGDGSFTLEVAYLMEYTLDGTTLTGAGADFIKQQ